MFTSKVNKLGLICKSWRRNRDVTIVNWPPSTPCGSALHQFQALSPVPTAGVWEIPRVVQTNAKDDSDHAAGGECPWPRRVQQSFAEVKRDQSLLWKSKTSESSLTILGLTKLLERMDWHKMHCFPLLSSFSRKVMALEALWSSLLRTYNMSATILDMMRKNLANFWMAGR